MTTIEKQQFKITIPSILSIIMCTVTVIATLYNFRDQNNADFNSLRGEVQSLKSRQEIITIQQTNQFKSLKNDIKRDSAYTVNGLSKIEAKVNETNSLLIRMVFNQRAVSEK